MIPVHPMTRLGLIGIALFIALNAFAVFVLEKPSAQPFSTDWWSQWFPVALVFLVLLLVGVARSLRMHPSS